MSRTGGQPSKEHGWITAQNETDAKLVVRGSGGSVLVFAPFESRRLRDDVCAGFRESLERLEELRCVSVRPDEPERPNPALGFVGVGFWLVVLWLIGGIFFSSPWYWIGGLFGAAIILLGGYLAYRGDPALIPLIISLLLVMTIGVIGPAALVYYGGDVHEAVDQVLDQDLADDELAFLTLIGRGLQWTFIVIASVLPALLFFMFDRVKLVTLRQSFERGMLRFDPTVSTLSDVRARYGPQMNEVYGRERPHSQGLILAAADQEKSSGEEDQDFRNGSRRVLPDRRGPVVMATVVITIGWILALLNPDVEAPLQGAQQIVLLFEPQRSPVVFAFLGAYVFSLNSVLRSYVRSDLRPKSYTHIVVRIIVAVVFAWVLEALFFATPQVSTGEDALLVLAFLVGMLPETLLVRLQEVGRQFVGKVGRLPQLVERYPLTDLEGIDIYDRARLLDEGVGNIEGLAHHDLPSLMMYTRIPVGRLVHWTDQAILFLHVAATSETNGASERRLARLKAYGIHTATDLEAACRYRADRVKKGSTATPAHEELEAFLYLIGETTAGKGRPLPRIEVILDALRDEQWMTNLRYWHDGCHDTLQTLELDGDGNLVEVGCDPSRAEAPPDVSSDGAANGGRARTATRARAG